MASKKKFFVVYRAHNFESNSFIDDNVFVCDTYEAAREVFDCLVKNYIDYFNENFNDRINYEVFENNFDRAIFNSIEAKTEDVMVAKDDDGIRFVCVQNTDNDNYFRVWMDEEPREVITTKTRFKGHLW